MDSDLVLRVDKLEEVLREAEEEEAARIEEEIKAQRETEAKTREQFHAPSMALLYPETRTNFFGAVISFANSSDSGVGSTETVAEAGLETSILEAGLETSILEAGLETPGIESGLETSRIEAEDEKETHGQKMIVAVLKVGCIINKLNVLKVGPPFNKELLPVHRPSWLKRADWNFFFSFFFIFYPPPPRTF